MKLQRNKRKGKGDLLLEITPMIDVVFLLLIFFLTATTFDERGGINVNLPKSTMQEVKGISNIQIIIDANKKISLKYTEDNKRHITSVGRGELKEVLYKKLLDSENKNVIISADKRVDYGEIVDIMTISKEVGADSIDLDTSLKK